MGYVCNSPGKGIKKNHLQTLCALDEFKMSRIFQSGVGQWLIHSQPSQEENLNNLDGEQKQAVNTMSKVEFH